VSVPNKIKNLTAGVVTSYDSSLSAVELLINKGLELLDGYRAEEAAVRGSLRDSLTSIGKLRRKDFDILVEPILEFQLRREKEIKSLIKKFLSSQGELTQKLKRSLEAGNLQEVEQTKGKLTRIIEAAKSEILAFQREQARIRETFDQLDSRKEKSVGALKQIVCDLERELGIITHSSSDEMYSETSGQRCVAG
jgi:hypothetical protein